MVILNKQALWKHWNANYITNTHVLFYHTFMLLQNVIPTFLEIQKIETSKYCNICMGA